MGLSDITAQDAGVALGAVAFNVFLATTLWIFRSDFLVSLERVVDWVQGQAARRRKNMYLAGNFAPVKDEVQAESLPVEGKLPKALDGVYARVGPNPVLPLNGDYHWCLHRPALDHETRHCQSP
jgi:carotenoid cleavage dioxygenase